MGKRGPRPKPKLTLITAEAKRETGPALPIARPQFPPWGADDVRPIFDWYADALVEAGICASIDSSIVYTLASAVWKKQLAEEIVSRSGVVGTGAKGGEYFAPAAAVSASCDGIIIRCLRQLGLDPISRERVPVAPVDVAKPQSDPTNRFIR